MLKRRNDSHTKLSVNCTTCSIFMSKVQLLLNESNPIFSHPCDHFLSLFNITLLNLTLSSKYVQRKIDHVSGKIQRIFSWQIACLYGCFECLFTRSRCPTLILFCKYYLLCFIPCVRKYFELDYLEHSYFNFIIRISKLLIYLYYYIVTVLVLCSKPIMLYCWKCFYKIYGKTWIYNVEKVITLLKLGFYSTSLIQQVSFYTFIFLNCISFDSNFFYIEVTYTLTFVAYSDIIGVVTLRVRVGRGIQMCLHVIPISFTSLPETTSYRSIFKQIIYLLSQMITLNPFTSQSITYFHSIIDYRINRFTNTLYTHCTYYTLLNTISIFRFGAPTSHSICYLLVIDQFSQVIS